jgi:hypothetical protein
MPKLIKELGKRIKGTLQETEDWWNLMQHEDGTLFVEHTWSHTKLNNLAAKGTDGEEHIEIEAFLADKHPWATDSRLALQEYLAEQGLS